MNKISVIVPVYNVEKYLDRCIESLVNQTYTKLEIILVDDGSTDNSPIICDKWAKKDSRIKVIHKENGGVSSARNNGIEVANGNIVHFVDSDDWLDKNAYFELMKNFDLSSFLVFNAYSYDGKCFEKIFDYENSELTDQNEIITELIKGNIGYTNCWCKLFLMEIIKNNNLRFRTDYKVGEDFYFLYEYAKLIDKVKFINLPLYYYDISREDSAMNSKGTGFLNCWKATEAILQNEIGNDAVYDVAAYRLINELVSRALMSAEFNNKKAYKQISKKLKEYYKKGLCKNRIALYIKAICFFPNIFRILYRINKLWKLR